MTQRINLVQLLNEAAKYGFTVEYSHDGEVIIIAKNGDTKAELGTIQGLIEVLQEKIEIEQN